jgi:hypothetical protein
MPADSSPPPDALTLIEALEAFAYRTRPVKAWLCHEDGTREDMSITEEYCKIRPYETRCMTGLDLNDIRVRIRLQALTAFREHNPSDPFPEDQDLWEDVTFDLVLQLQVGQLRGWAREGSPLGRLIDFWESVHRHDIDWCRSSLPSLGLYSIKVAPAKSAQIGSPSTKPTRKRGPYPKQFNRVREAMRRDVAEHGAAFLNGMKEEEMATQYGASRDTCRRVRTALSEN